MLRIWILHMELLQSLAQTTSYFVEIFWWFHWALDEDQRLNTQKSVLTGSCYYPTVQALEKQLVFLAATSLLK